MHIWIDLANSPQVLFFRPLLKKFQDLGHSVTITSRNFAQTKELADQFGLSHTPIGGHAGEKSLVWSLWVNILRARHLTQFLAGQSIDLAISHNSYAQALAATWKRLSLATAMDYEHQSGNHLPFRLADLVIVPEAFPDSFLRKYGAKRYYKYPGIKEQIYLSDFEPDPHFRERIGLPLNKQIVLLRPPATWAMYHQGIENHTVSAVLEKLGKRDDLQIVFLPRILAQRISVEKMNIPNIWIPSQAVDGPNLIYASDLVISAGGTMNREAAVLGVPVYTTFVGKLAAVDQYLIDSGRLLVMQDVDLLNNALPERQKTMMSSGQLLVDRIADAFLSAAN